VNNILGGIDGSVEHQGKTIDFAKLQRGQFAGVHGDFFYGSVKYLASALEIFRLAVPQSGKERH
jgi:hypothetical protein